ncbi:hypothetical protein SAMN05192559_101613 [Halobacillus karajensis]|uniref:Uncharacterized protein n=1 Tax=Halobacillus karajensis TaxID=195088 RepID=A0A024P448_9BACI|nr:hypothetical protein [Halobacillus karajensis]CDQ18750.1 hypothetical protein BN982_01029 [Halobacillus karajensis]CDQ23178.1 hypothetical protein BN983_01399 [Halobacillus karajensis]CDQ26660.1 hypothetical protein BN981_00879 [Halobacillus karajensis]SEH46785.1 hypothetical protein SAMN05192559_101613 [Halobacillus karajensis]
MEKQSLSKLDKWQAKYGVLVIALCCLYISISSWGQNWILKSMLVLGTFVCGAIGFFDVKRAIKEKHFRQ